MVVAKSYHIQRIEEMMNEILTVECDWSSKLDEKLLHDLYYEQIKLKIGVDQETHGANYSLSHYAISINELDWIVEDPLKPSDRDLGFESIVLDYYRYLEGLIYENVYQSDEYVMVHCLVSVVMVNDEQLHWMNERFHQ